MDVNYYVSEIPLIKADSSCGSHMTRYVISHDFDRVTAERDALQRLLNARDEEVDSLRADAERYRWMKSNVNGGSMGIPEGWIDDNTEEWDESIDRYIHQENQA